MPSPITSPRFHALIPAAGSGSRMGAELPKQYLPLCGRPLLAYAIDALLAVPRIATLTVVLAPADAHWNRYLWPQDARLRCCRAGGASRAATVSAGLADVAAVAAEHDWVLVHDAARACLQPASVEHLLDTLADDAVGGLLALPVADTLKRADASGRVAATVSRAAMWQAQTPQMFRLGLLRRALAAQPDVTDEAAAVEAYGLAPRLVTAPASNFKITYPEDLALAARLLGARHNMEL